MSLFPNGYGSTMLTLAQLRAIHEPRMHPEFARRLFAWLAARDGVGIGGGWRATGTQPNQPGFAPEGKSFHQDQRFASGFVGYAAVDLVVAVPGKVHRAPMWAESADAPLWGLHTFVAGEPWHMQPIEIRGWQSWVDAGRRDPDPTFQLPGEDVEDEEVKPLYILKPQGAWAKPWFPWLVVTSDLRSHVTVSGEGAGLPIKTVTDEGQYRRRCHQDGIQLSVEAP